MTALRHLGRGLFYVEDKRSGSWSVSSAGTTHLADLSGSSLVQNLSDVPVPPSNSFALVTPSGGVETSSCAELEEEALKRSRLKGGGCLWASSGSDAMEMALWAADVYASNTWDEVVKTFLVRRGSYHGNTYLTRFLSTRGFVERPLSMDRRALVILEEEPAPAAANPLLEALREAERRGRIARPAALVCEPLPTTGKIFWPGEEAYRQTIRWCRQRDIFVIFDEVASGAYRHRHFNAFAWAEGEEGAPDISAISKGLTSGTFPLSCVVLSRRLTEFLENRRVRPLSFTHGLSEPAAWFTLASLRRYDDIFASPAYAARCALINTLARYAATQLPRATVEHSETTIRLSMSAAQSRAVLRALINASLWAYCGYTDFPSAGGPEPRAFIHLCPPFDLSVEQTEQLLTEALNVASGVLSDASVSLQVTGA